MSHTSSHRRLVAAGALFVSLALTATFDTSSTSTPIAEAASLEATVARALIDDLGDQASDIQISVGGNVVTLSGVVLDDAIRDRAEKIAYGVAAVARVENRLRILRAPVNPRALGRD